MHLSDEIRRTLQYKDVLALFEKETRSPLGSFALSRMRPADTFIELKARQDLLHSYRSHRDSKGELPWQQGIQCVDELLASAKHTSFLTGEEFIRIRGLLHLSTRLRDVLQSELTTHEAFGMLLKRLRDFSPEYEALGVFDEYGTLYDHASPELHAIREELETIGRSVRRTGQDLISDSKVSSMLQDRVLSVRLGRYVVLVRQDCISRFPGTILDRSSSGNSVYMEPRSLNALNNRLVMRQRDEKEEEQRILRRLTAYILSRERAILEAQEVLGMVDVLHAAANRMDRGGWILPLLEDRARFSLYDARHPLLGDRAVPSSIICGEGFRVLVITGPNTGGKTVVLKTAGICLALAWCGLPIAASENSVVGTISSIFADIGDEQSIEQNLSTFSAHLAHVVRILRDADASSLVLLDELGAGTDPQEGAALGVAILDALRKKRSLVLASTHHNPIKQYALTTSGVESASMEFDADTLSPTFRLLMGIPGKSNAILIAERLGLPPDVIERARHVLREREIPVEDLISELQERRVLLDREKKEFLLDRKQLEETKRTYEDRVASLEFEKNKILEKADRDAAGILAAAETASRTMIRELEGVAKSAAHRKLHEKKEETGLLIRDIEDREKKRTLSRKMTKTEGLPLAPGVPVEVIGTGVVGILLRVDGKKAFVEAGAMTVEVPSESVVPSKKGPKAREVHGEVYLERPEHVSSSIMVRGMNVQEALPLVERYLDQAMRCGYSSVTVIHGRGEGILRREVHALCSRLKYVQEYRLGDGSEGGYGVTIVTFKR